MGFLHPFDSRQINLDWNTLQTYLRAHGKNIVDGTEMSISTARKFFEGLVPQRGTLKAERHATLARGMARSLAWRNDKRMSTEAMHDLIDRLFACEMPYFTPGGSPVLITWTLQELDERFQR